MSKSLIQKPFILSFYGGHNASVCLLHKGELHAHFELERITRQKEQSGAGLFDSAIHGEAPWVEKGMGYFIELFLEQEGVSLQDIEAVALIPDGIAMGNDNLFAPRGLKIILVDHHVAHAASSFFLSPFKTAGIITIDGGGNDGGGLIGVGKENRLELFPFLQSGAVGVFWDILKQYWSKTVHGPIGTEGVLMGAAAYGVPSEAQIEFFLRRFIELTKIKTDVITRLVQREIDSLFQNGPRSGILPLSFTPTSEEHYFDLCASLQEATIRFLRSILKEVQERFQMKDICWAGGVALNCNALGRIIEESSEYDFYLPPAVTDSGLTIGASLYVYHHVLQNERVLKKGNASPYLGGAYSIPAPPSTLRRIGSADAGTLAHLLTEGAIISIFQGRSESGRRALGNRSIIADPRSESMRQKINERVKHRHWYRPFAPAIMAENVREVFEVEKESPYMSLALTVKEEWRGRIPAVLHKDNTARLQTVQEEDNPVYYAIIEAFFRETGVPLILNTSFNDREPIVETPEDAIRCFLGTEIDYLYLEGELYAREL